MADDTKAELIAQLDQSRGQFSRDWSRFRHDIDVQGHVRSAFANHKAAWVGGAALFGWLLSRLPARRKTVKVLVDKEGHTIKKLAEGGLLLALGKLAFSALKPAVAAIATRKIKEFAENRAGR